MVILQQKKTVIPLLALLALAVTPRLQFDPLKTALLPPAAAQTASPPPFSPPQTVARGTRITINGSSQMDTINQALKQRFEQQFAGTNVAITRKSTDAALEDLRQGKVDLVATGRPLTAAEKAEGLVAVPVARHKIAVIVAPDNPFKGSLTIDQFAKIFRGEITDWSQVGGAKGSVRLVDRPETSDTRQAFLNYPVFQKGKFETGANALKLKEDETTAVVQNLGTDGVGYAIADQVLDNPNIRILQLHKTLPTDPRYPFSQPLAYVYRGPAPSPEVQAFLGYALAPESQTVVEAARSEAMKAPEAQQPDVVTTETGKDTQTPAQEGQPPAGSLWWLLLPLLGLPLLLWWLRGRSAPLASARHPSRIILTPRNCRDVYAYWELSEDDKKLYQAQGKKQALRLYDVTDINLDSQPPHTMQQFECDYQKQCDLHLPVPVDNRDYLVELGYLNAKDEWVTLARSEHVRVPQCSPVGTPANLTDGVNAPAPATPTETGTAHIAAAAGAVAAAGAAIADRSILAGDRGPMPTPAHETEHSSRIILTPRNPADVYAYWEVPDEHKAALRQQGGRHLALRLYDVTEIAGDAQEPHAMYEFACSETEQDRHLPVRVSDRDYQVEIGYTTDDGRWLPLAQSQAVRVESEKNHSSI